MQTIFKIFDNMIDWITIKLLNVVFSEDHKELFKQEIDNSPRKNKKDYIWTF